MDADFQNLIDGTLSNSAQVQTFIAIARQLEQEAQEQDEENLGTSVPVSGYVNHFGGGQSVSDSLFTSTGNGTAAYNPSLYGQDDATSGDQAVIDSVLSQVTSLSDAIVFNFEATHEVVNYIIEELGKHSPYKSGRYMHSHVVFADGVLLDNFSSLNDFSAGPTANTSEFLFVNTLPYSRKIEAGESAMAPNGVYEVVAHEAQEKYGSTCIIDFIDYAGTYGVFSEATSASYGHRTKLHMNKAENRFPAIRVTFPTK